MSTAKLPILEPGQPDDVRDLELETRNRLVVFISQTNGVPAIESLYGDSVWWPVGSTTNTSRSRVKMDFKTIPAAFEDVAKAMVYRYLRRGCAGRKRPKAASLVKFFNGAKDFLQYIDGIGVGRLTEVTPLVCSTYLQHLRVPKRRGKMEEDVSVSQVRPISKSQYTKRVRIVERIYELSQFTSAPMNSYPWPDKSAVALKRGLHGDEKTPLIPDRVFEALFLSAWSAVEQATALLDHRDALAAFERRNPGFAPKYLSKKKNEVLAQRGFEGTCRTLNMAINGLRTACYIVIASVSGCRNHELGNLQTGCYYSTCDSEGNAYWWMRSQSSKTEAGHTEWMVPEPAVTALRVLERWGESCRELLEAEIKELAEGAVRRKDLGNPEEHVNALFLGVDLRHNRLVRTLSLQAVNNSLKDFAAKAGLDWKLASHQFRRKFANYAARSQFGDLRYLKEHFKHWSMDMTLGYALNDSQEMALYLEIQDELDEIKYGVVETWLDSDEPLAGGYGQGLIEWRSKTENVILFKSRAAMVRSIAESTPIRSNGQAWCTAPDNLCVGNDLERTRCGDGCDNSVIGRQHAPVYQGLYDHLKELSALDDIGESGQARVQRDLTRCAKVLNALSAEPISETPW
ncbi:Phage integrase family protein [Burkholderia sp. YR290]|nr:Phage integrase family protein [Burkholderia sp. YR290]